MFSWEPIVACLIPNLGGWVGGLFVKSSLTTWYKDLRKAPWNPPDWVFGPVWTTLYTAMGFASYLVYRDGGGFNDNTNLTFAVYAIQLIINWAFSPIFFGCRSVKWGMVDVIVLVVGASICAVLFSRVNPLAGALLIPYLGWLCLATTLSIYLYIHNKHDRHKKPHHHHQDSKEHSQ